TPSPPAPARVPRRCATTSPFLSSNPEPDPNPRPDRGARSPLPFCSDGPPLEGSGAFCHSPAPHGKASISHGSAFHRWQSTLARNLRSPLRRWLSAAGSGGTADPDAASSVATLRRQCAGYLTGTAGLGGHS